MRPELDKVQREPSVAGKRSGSAWHFSCILKTTGIGLTAIGGGGVREPSGGDQMGKGGGL